MGVEGCCMLFAGAMRFWQLVWNPEAGKNVEEKPRTQPKHSPDDEVQWSFLRGALSRRGIGTVHEDAGVQYINEPM